MSSATVKNNRDLSSLLEADIWIEWLRSAWNIDPCKADVIRTIVEKILSRRKELGLKVLNHILDENPEEFVHACFTIRQRPNSMECFIVPDALRNIANLKDSEIGAGEILVLFMVSDSEWFYGKTIDVSIFDEFWHVKQITKKDRRARMGSSQEYSYMSSPVALKLSQIRPTFISSLNGSLVFQYEKEISELFGSIEIFWEVLKEECIRREFSRAAGVCFYDQDRNVIEFHRKDDILLVGATQGRYRIKAIEPKEEK